MNDFCYNMEQTSDLIQSQSHASTHTHTQRRTNLTFKDLKVTSWSFACRYTITHPPQGSASSVSSTTVTNLQGKHDSLLEISYTENDPVNPVTALMCLRPDIKHATSLN